MPELAPIDGYVLARTTEEYQRLRKQAQLWDDATRKVLTAAGLSSGMRCADIGCGPGNVMALMAEQVGDGGHVTGVDSDPALGREALTYLRGKGPDIFSFVEGDVTKLEMIAGEPLDFVFSRLLFFHLPDAVGTLRKFMRWVKPGGMLCIMDYDEGGCIAYAKSAGPGRAVELIRQAFVAAGKHPRIGSEMPFAIQRAFGHWPIGLECFARVLPLFEATDMDLRPLLRSLRPTLTGVMNIQGSELDELDRELAGITPDTLGCVVMPMMIASWLKKSQ